MSVATAAGFGKGGSTTSAAETLSRIAAGIGELVEGAASAGTTLREFERNLCDQLLRIGHAATEQFLALQGDGDLGETTTDDAGRTLHRSPAPVERPLRTIFRQRLSVDTLEQVSQRRGAAAAGEPPQGDLGRRILGGPPRPHAGGGRRGAVSRST